MQIEIFKIILHIYIKILVVQFNTYLLIINIGRNKKWSLRSIFILLIILQLCYVANVDNSERKMKLFVEICCTKYDVHFNTLIN